MKDILIVAPIKKPEDVESFIPFTKCRDFYVYYNKFLNNNFEYINDFIQAAHENNSKIYINFKHDISEEDLTEIKKLINDGEEYILKIDKAVKESYKGDESEPQSAACR